MILFSTLLQKLLDGTDLSALEMQCAMQSIMKEEYSAAQVAAFLIALRSKGESVIEITGAANVMRSLMRPVKPVVENLVDTCGTGGDGAQLFNVSTAAAIVAASAGVPIAKHGGRSVSSQSGSSDVLEALGIPLESDAIRIAQSIDENNIGFLFAPHFHPTMKIVAPVRREIGVRTIFNLLGPLTNPANVKRHVLGVFAKQWLLPIAQVLQELGSTHALILHAENGTDEAALDGKTYVAELKNDAIQTYTINAEDLGLASQSMERCTVTDRDASKKIILSALKNEDGTARDLVALNAGAAIYVGGKAASWKEGVGLALTAIADGNAFKKLEQLQAWSGASLLLPSGHPLP